MTLFNQPTLAFRTRAGWRLAAISVAFWGCTQAPVETPNYTTAGTGNCNDNGNDSTLRLTQDDPNYDDDIADMIEDKCITCHDTDDQEPFLADWDDVEAVKRLVVSEVVDETMPPNRPLTNDDIDIYQAWKDADYPENANDDGSSSEDDSSDRDDSDRDADDSDRDRDPDEEDARGSSSSAKSRSGTGC